MCSESRLALERKAELRPWWWQYSTWSKQWSQFSSRRSCRKHSTDWWVSISLFSMFSHKFYASFLEKVFLWKNKIGEVAKLFADAGIICIASLISPYRIDRDACRSLLPEGDFIEVCSYPCGICFVDIREQENWFSFSSVIASKWIKIFSHLISLLLW